MSIRAKLFLFIAAIFVISAIYVLDIVLGGLVDKADEHYHAFLDQEKDFAQLIIQEQSVMGNPSDYQLVLERYQQLSDHLQHKQNIETQRVLSERKTQFENLFETNRQIEHRHQEIRRLLPDLIESVRYIHEHHIAYLENLLHRGQHIQDYDVGPDFRRSPMQAAPELDIIGMAVSIQNHLLDIAELFNRVHQGDNPSMLETSFQEKIHRFYASVNTFEDYSLDAQDGLLVEELLITGRQFESAFTHLLAGERRMKSITGQMGDNAELLINNFKQVRQNEAEDRDRRIGQLRALQYTSALGFVCLVLYLLHAGRRLNKAFERTVKETEHIQADTGYQIPINKDNAHEFRVVYKAMNTMAKTINKQVLDLETARGDLSQRVKARTAALERANGLLKREIADREAAEKQRIDLETKLNRAKKMEAIGTLAGGVAHDLNNILSGIVSYPDLILNDLSASHPIRKSLETIKSSGEKAAAIVQDLLTLARRGVSGAEAIDLRQIVEAYCSSPEFQQLKKENPHIQFGINVKLDRATIRGSHVHLEKTVMNLVSNAVEAIPTDGVVTLTIESVYIDTALKGYDVVNEGDYVKLTVADNGIGIAEHDLERIFEPFFTKKKMGRSGTGLGMAVVWGTVKDHNGYIDVQSQEGKGTAFSLYFPMRRDIRVAHKPVQSLENIKGNGQSILVVDDIPEQREIAVLILSRLGYAATAVQSGEAAVAYIENTAVDLLLLDMIMKPGMDGLDTYQQILAKRPGTPAVIASGFSETERVREAQRLGARHYIRKPYTIENIALAVKDALRVN